MVAERENRGKAVNSKTGCCLPALKPEPKFKHQTVQSQSQSQKPKPKAKANGRTHRGRSHKEASRETERGQNTGVQGWCLFVSAVSSSLLRTSYDCSCTVLYAVSLP